MAGGVAEANAVGAAGFLPFNELMTMTCLLN